MTRTDGGITMTQRLTLAADARMRLLMERRQSEGKPTLAPSSARSVLWALINRSDGDGRCWPGIERLARESDTSRATLKRVMRIFEEEGLIIVKRRNRSQGVAKIDATNMYWLQWGKIAELREGGLLTVSGLRVSRDQGDGAGLRMSHDQGSNEGRSGLNRSGNRAQAEPQTETETEMNPQLNREEGEGSEVVVEFETVAVGYDKPEEVSLVEFSDSGSRSRRAGLISWLSSLTPLVGRLGRGSCDTSAQARADRTSAERLFEQVWPVDADDDTGKSRLIDAADLVDLAARNGTKPMAYLTRLVKKEFGH